MKNTINSGLAFISGVAACNRNAKKVDPFDRHYGIYYAYRAACELGDFVDGTDASVSFVAGWNDAETEAWELKMAAEALGA